jgi:hypothetical protein
MRSPTKLDTTFGDYEEGEGFHWKAVYRGMDPKVFPIHRPGRRMTKIYSANSGNAMPTSPTAFISYSWVLVSNSKRADCGPTEFCRNHVLWMSRSSDLAKPRLLTRTRLIALGSVECIKNSWLVSVNPASSSFTDYGPTAHASPS